MKISEIRDYLGAEVLCGEENLEHEVISACCSDMMSDVLAFVKDQGVLITGLINSQVIRTANMMDMVCVVFVRSKTPTEDMVESKLRAYEASGILYSQGLGRGGSDV